MSLHRHLGILRGLLISVGLVLFVAGLDAVASMPTPPPESDGFIEGLTYIFALVLGVAGLLAVQVGYAVPAGTGRFEFGPLADRSPGLRSGVAVLVYLSIAVLMVYGVPVVVPSVTESMTYATGLFVFAIAAIVGSVIACCLAAAGFLTRSVRAL